MNGKRPPLDEVVELYTAVIAAPTRITTGAGNIGGTSVFDAGLIGAGINSFLSMLIIIHPGELLLVDSSDITGFNNVTGEIIFNTPYKGGQVPAGAPYKIVPFRFVPAEVAALTALVTALMADVGDPTGETLPSLATKWGNIARSLDLILGARWDAAGDLGTDITAILVSLPGKPNVQDIVIYPVAEDADTTELADDGSSPAYYPVAAHSTNVVGEGNAVAAWTEDINFEQEGTINIISIYAEFEWQTRFLVGAGNGTNTVSKIQISRDGGATWVDLTDNYQHNNAVMTNRVREGGGRWIPTVVAGANQLQFRLVHWVDVGNGISTSEAQIRSNSFVRITYRKS